MSLAKILTIFVIAFAAVRALPLHDENPEKKSDESKPISFRLPDNTRPVHYDVKLNPHFANGDFTFDGECRIDFEVLKPTSSIALHMEDIELNKTATKLRTKDGDVLAPEKYNYNSDSNIMVMQFSQQLEPGSCGLRVKYKGNLTDDPLGFYRTSYEDEDGNTVWLVATQFEPFWARRAFPCWDEPALKATFNISVKHHANYTAHSNMPVKSQSEIDETDGKLWTNFEKTPVMSSYLVAVVVSNYEKLSNADNTISVWTRKKYMPYAKKILDIAEKSTAELEKFTNSSVRVPKMDHISLPSHSAGAMENWGLITYPERKFYYNTDEVSQEHVMSIIETIIHELTHQWFGNVVSPTWWSHVWLNEGFASYFEHYIIDKILPNYRGSDYFMLYVVRISLDVDVISHVRPIDADVNKPEEILQSFSMASYGKAPAILHMLSHIVTKDVFHKALVKYLDTHQYDSANPDCLWTSLQNALNESDVPHNDFNVKEIMDTWIKQKRYPLITVNRDYSTGETEIMQEDFGKVEVHKHYYDDDDNEDYTDENEIKKWWIPVNYATKSNPDFSRTQPTDWLTPDKNLTINGIDANDWMIVNNQMTGYYRVDYDDTNWERIAEYLNSDDYQKIPLLNRAQIINDATQLVINRRMKPSMFIKLLGYLEKETDYVPWHFGFDFLGSVKSYLRYPEAAVLKLRLIKLLEKVYNDVGCDDKPDDVPLTVVKRASVCRWMCKLGYQPCLEHATARLAKYLEDPKKNKMRLDERRLVLCFGMTNANETIWDKMLEKCLQTKDRPIFRFISCAENPKLVEKNFNLTLSNDTRISDDDRVSMFYTAFDNENLVDLTLDFLVRNWPELIARIDGIDSSVFGISRRVKTKGQLEKLRQLYKAYGMDDQAAEEDVKKEEKRMDTDIARIREWTAVFS